MPALIINAHFSNYLLKLYNHSLNNLRFLLTTTEFKKNVSKSLAPLRPPKDDKLFMHVLQNQRSLNWSAEKQKQKKT